MASGGGYGSPLERDALLVARDVWNELILVEFARDAYGVVVDVESGEVNGEGTSALRARLRERESAGEWSPHQLARGTGRRTAMIFSKCEDRDLFKRHDFSLRTVELLLRHSAASSAARLVDKSSSFSKRVSKLSRITRYRADGLTDYVAPDQSPIYLGFVAARVSILAPWD
jgi:2,3-bisphosphoglycerate-independent phosphoglycerate mutase